MKGRILVVDWKRHPVRCIGAALIVNGRVEDLLLAGGEGPMAGHCYWATVDRLIPGGGSAFVKLDCAGIGFLRHAAGAQPGQRIAVQVTANAEPGKAPPVSTEIVNKTRRFLLTIGKPGVNVSRAIRSADEKNRLKAFVESWLAANAVRGNPYDLPDPVGAHGIVVRTAAEGASELELDQELGELLHAWRSFATLPRDFRPPLGRGGLAECTGNVPWHALHEWTAPLPDEYVENDPAPALELRESGLPGSGSGEEVAMASVEFWRRHRHAADADLFDHYGVWDEIERLKSPRVDLPSGGWMAIEPTRAMVTVDVNTAGEFSSGAALSANLEAARELPRQLRLRGLGGQVVIDFAPLPKKDRRRVEDALKTAFRRDPVETTLAGWTPLGNFELQRKRERRPLIELLPG